MKNTYQRLVLLVLLLLAGSAAAQERQPKVEITAMASYFFEGNFEVDYGFDDFLEDDVELDQGDAFGLIVAFPINRSFDLELSYTKLDSALQTDNFFAPEPEDLPLDAEYFHIGGAFNFNAGHLEPFIFASVGATRLTPKANDFDDEVRASVGFGGGLKVNFSEHVGLRLQVRLLSTLIDSDEEAFCNRRDCYYYDEDTFLYQAEAGAGIAFRF